MNEKKLPVEVQAKLNEWFDREVTPLHIWEIDKVFCVIVSEDNDLYCMRLWLSAFNGQVQLSQDNIIYDMARMVETE